MFGFPAVYQGIAHQDELTQCKHGISMIIVTVYMGEMG